MGNALLRRAREIGLSINGIRELEPLLPDTDADLQASLEEALGQRDGVAFTRVLLAASDIGRSVDAQFLEKGAALLGEPYFLIAAALPMKGDLTDALLKAVDGQWLPYGVESTALYLATWWCHEHQRQFPPALIARLRTCGRRSQSSIMASRTLRAAAETIEDENLNTIMGLQNGAPATSKPSKQLMQDQIERLKQSPLSLLPESAPSVIAAGYTVRRAAPRVGRNEPCPCGSGKKYKKCCISKDEERLQHSSPVSGLTLEEYRQNQEQYLTEERLKAMPPYEVARLDPVKVPAHLRRYLINRLHMGGEHQAALNLFQKVDFEPELVDFWMDAIYGAAEAKKKRVVQELLALDEYRRHLDEPLPLQARVLLLEDEPEQLLKLMEETAVEGLTQNDSDERIVELAYGLMEGPCPGLGILVARSLIPIGGELEGLTLLDSLLETRDRLNLSAGDPFEQVADRLFRPEREEQDRESRELKEARERLQSKDKEVAKLNQKLQRLDEDLRKSQQKKETQSQEKPEQQKQAHENHEEGQKARELRQRLDYLKNLLKERQAEKRQLRQDLKDALGKVEELQSASPDEETHHDGEDRLLGDEVPTSQPIRFPHFKEDFQEAIKSVPKPVAASAMALIGEMAAGFSSAFQGTKQIKTNKAFMRQRVGSDYRLLFRFDRESLTIVTLIHRKEFERALKSLKA